MPALNRTTSARPNRRTSGVGLLRVARRSTPVLAALLLGSLGCREDADSPTAPQTGPALATSATPALTFYQVSGGDLHSCGVTTDNRAYCWGRNIFGALGDGTITDRLTPVAVAGALHFRQVSADKFHTCGVTTDYRVYCWGSNSNGELGDGTTTQRLTPVPVAGGHQFRQVDAGENHTCAVSYPDNRAYCWGANSSGQLGNPTIYYSLSPVAVTSTLSFRQVAAGVNHTCGVTTENRAYCWGSNIRGEVGDSSTADYRPTPSAVAGTRRFRQVDAGDRFSCAVTTTDRAFCWGEGRAGQIGDGKTYLRFWPRAVAGGFSFARVTTGANHTCAETTENRAYCWGVNGGMLGDGTTTQRLTPVAVVGGLFFSQVSAGGAHTCGRTGAGIAYCWGGNFDGELGEGTTITRLVPVKVAGAL
jgi:alpha-tubulin suppressor-like RCC1 family protein